MLFPGVLIPLLSSLYQGIPATYSSWLVLSVLGSNIFTIRIAHAIYGALTLLFFQLLLKSMRKKRRLSFFVCTLFATDLAYIACYRDQYQAVLTGTPFLILSLYLTYLVGQSTRSKRWVYGAGIALGFSMYCYFPYFFFFIPLAFYIYKIRLGSTHWQRLTHWLTGVFVGFLPFIAGYVSMYLWAGRNWATFTSTIDSMRAQIGIRPSNLSYPEKVQISFDLLQSALTNAGNSALILGTNVPLALVKWNLGFFTFIITFVVGVALVLGVKSFRSNGFYLLIIFLLLTFFLSISYFGDRLGPWHFTPLIPLTYLLTFIVLGEGADFLKNSQFSKNLKHISTTLILILALGSLSLNFFQQKTFHEQLKLTGGVGMMTDALTTMQYDAINEGDKSIYFFPEWGFSTSFALITDNRIRFSYDTRTDVFKNELLQGRNLAILTWSEKNAKNWADQLESLDAQPRVSLIPYYTRQGMIAFYKVVAFAK